jgi:hypothetical protein
MLIHHLIRRFPGKYRAAAPVFGLPLLGYLVGGQYELLRQPQAAARTQLLQLHDRSDVTIPWEGGVSKDGWLYESRDRSLGAWAVLQGCSVAPQGVTSPFDGGPTHVACKRYVGCQNGGIVMYCMYDGNHGDWPDQPRGAELVWSFFGNVSRVPV